MKLCRLFILKLRNLWVSVQINWTIKVKKGFMFSKNRIKTRIKLFYKIYWIYLRIKVYKKRSVIISFSEMPTLSDLNKFVSNKSNEQLLVNIVIIS